jgi:hypothetical protein
LRHLPQRDAKVDEGLQIDGRRAEAAIYGMLVIKRGLKRKARRHQQPIRRPMKEVLEKLISASQCEWVFTSPIDTARPLGPWVLEEQIAQSRKKIKTHPMRGSTLVGIRF